MDTEPTAVELRQEIQRLLAAAFAAQDRHDAEMDRRDVLHVAETDRRDLLHIEEMERRGALHAQEIALIREALETRDVIGQAKGIIMSTMLCSGDEAFRLLRHQSQHENRKLADVAVEVVAGVTKRVRPPNASPSTG